MNKRDFNMRRRHIRNGRASQDTERSKPERVEDLEHDRQVETDRKRPEGEGPGGKEQGHG